MKMYLQICSVILLFLSMSSCKGQNKTDSPQTKENSYIPIEEITTPDIDPYFVESKTVTSPYGPTDITRNILEDSKGNIWLATWEGIIGFDGENFTNYTNKEGLRPFHVFTILEDSKGIIWFGTIGAGVYRYDGKTFVNFTKNEGLVHNRVGCIYEDKMGKIWFGTEGGASCYDGQTFQNFTTKDGLINNDINSIIEDKNGTLWFGARGDACTFDGEKFTKITNDTGMSFTNVRSIIKDKNDDIWLGGNDGLWKYDGISYDILTTDFVGYLHEDRAGNIWTSSAVNGNAGIWTLSRYDEKRKPTKIKTENNMFFGIMEDTKGDIWMGTLRGVYRYDGEDFDYFREG